MILAGVTADDLTQAVLDSGKLSGNGLNVRGRNLTLMIMTRSWSVVKLMARALEGIRTILM